MSVIDEVRERLDIVEVVSRQVPLHKAGRHFKAHCPFHQERTPSFFVFPDRQSWRCFGSCSAGGDVFTFVMKKEGLSFGEALRLLAQEVGVSLAPAAAQQAHERERQRLSEINAAAARFYHQLLMGPQGARARSYLEERGVRASTMERFQLGSSLEGWDQLGRALRDLGYPQEDLLAVGLQVAGERGNHDLFRQRLLFPIRDPEGRVAGFGGRALDDAPPKYLNTPQTILFDKGSLLYGMDQAKEALRQHNQAVIVEGYFDVVIAHQAGFANVVAVLGTALSERHFRVLRRYTKNVALALDADAAGSAATLRGLEVARDSLERKVVPVPTWRGWIQYQQSLDADLHIIALPWGQDPDEVILKDPEEWRRLTAAALPVVDHLMTVVASQEDLSQPKGKAQALERLAPLLQEITDPVQQAHYLQKLGQLLRVDEGVVQASLSRYAGRRRGKKAPKEPQPSLEGRLEAQQRRQEHCLALLVQHPWLRDQVRGLSSEVFEREEHRWVFASLMGQGDEDGTLAEDLAPVMQRLSALPLPPASDSQRLEALRDVVRRLEEYHLRRLKDQESRFLQESQADVIFHNLSAASLALGQEGGELSEDERARVAAVHQEGVAMAQRLRRLTAERRKA